jgi:hypothetical protein
MFVIILPVEGAKLEFRAVNKNVRFEVFTVVIMKIIVFWD